MRVGYGLVPKTMPHMENIQPCHNVSYVSSEAAIASLDDLDYLMGVVGEITASRDQLAESLREIPGVVPYPSATNFLLIELPVVGAGPVMAELANRGIRAPFQRSRPRTRHRLVGDRLLGLHIRN